MGIFLILICSVINLSWAQDEKTSESSIEKPHNKIMLAVVGAKTLTQNEPGDRWSFDQPSVGVEIHANEYVAAQVSLTLLEQQYLVSKANADVLMSRRRLVLPLMVSYRAFPWLYISAGPYAGFAMNDVKTWRRGLDPALPPPKSSMNDFLEFGFVSAVQFFIPVTEKIEGMASVYYYVPYDETQLKKSNSLFFLLGVKFGLKK